MLYLSRYPFVRLLLPFIAGIVMAEYMVIEQSHYMLWLFAFTTALMISVYKWNRSYPLRWMFGAIVSLLMIMAGILAMHIQNPTSSPRHFSHEIFQKPSAILARVSEAPQEREKTYRFTLELLQQKDSSGWQHISGNVLAYISRNTEKEIPQYGDIIILHSYPLPLTAPINPEQFDFRKHLKRKGIYHQIFLKDEEWQQSGQQSANFLYKTGYSLRDRLLKVLMDNGISGDEYHVASAVLLGYDDQLPAYLRTGYTAAGAMHVLCVSGMHVGIIFLIFNFLLKPLEKKKWGITVKALLLLGLIWFYALITGLSPSVQRASVMISFMLFAQVFKRKGFALNSLAASALIILLFQPTVLFNIGFQLSYSAVAGILFLQKPVYNLLFIKFRFLDFFWEATTVAIAAQLATTPFVLYYFNQFPTYFLLSNLFLTPLSFAIIVSGMVLLLVSFIPVLPMLIGWLVSGLVYIMNYLILWTEDLPGSVISGIYISLFDAGIIIFAVILLTRVAETGLKPILIPFLTVVLLLFSSITARNIEIHSQQKTTVYGINRSTGIGFIQGRQLWMLADSALISDAFAHDFHLKKHWIKSGTEKAEWIDTRTDYEGKILKKTGPFIEFNGLKMMLWNKRIRYFKESEDHKPALDIVIISGNIPEQVSKIVSFCTPKLLIADASVPQWQLEKWRTATEEHGIAFHDIRGQGAFIHAVNR